MIARLTAQKLKEIQENAVISRRALSFNYTPPSIFKNRFFAMSRPRQAIAEIKPKPVETGVERFTWRLKMVLGYFPKE